MRRPSPLVLVLAGACAGLGLTTPAHATGVLVQQARTLTWSGRPAIAAPAEIAPAATAALPAPRPRRANRPIPHGGYAMPVTPERGLTPAPGATSVGLTPANAWLRRRAPAPGPAPEIDTAVEAEAPAPVEAVAPRSAPPAPVSFAAAAPTPAPRPALRPAPELTPAPAVDYLRDGGGQPAPAAVAYPAPMEPTPAAPVVADPMAPRRDAPIFRLQRPAPQPVDAPVAVEADEGEADEPSRPRQVAVVTPNLADRPSQQGARYYSLHRQSGRTPDALTLPQPTYIDALAVTLTDTPASQDLAEPAPGPTLIRDNTGRTRVAPAASDGDHQ